MKIPLGKQGFIEGRLAREAATDTEILLPLPSAGIAARS